MVLSARMQKLQREGGCDDHWVERGQRLQETNHRKNRKSSQGLGTSAENQIDKRDRTLSSMLHFFKNATQVLQTIRIQKSQAVGTLYFLACYCENVYNKKF